MKKNLFDSFLRLLSKITHKHVTYVSSSKIQATNLAAKSIYGFWYCGNVFDQGDVAYGVANNGTVEDFDTSLVNTLLHHLSKNKPITVYDIGANTGWYTMLASVVSPTLKVHAFEPIEEHLIILKESIDLNKKNDQISVYDIALSDMEGTSTIRLAGSGSSLEKDFLSLDRGTRTITIKKLDSFTQEKNISLPDFIKIDVEGHEYKVLQGAKNTIAKSTPILFIEIAYTLQTTGSSFVNHNFQKMFDELKSLNYTPFIVHNNNIQEYNPSHKKDGVYMYLFLHKEKHSDLVQKIKSNTLLS